MALKLTPSHILKFQKIYEERFGKKLSDDDAYEMGMKLVLLMKKLGESSVKDQKRNARSDKNENNQSPHGV